MTDINKIIVRGRQPICMPEQLNHWLKQMCFDSNVIELYGPSAMNDNIEVYGYYVPDLHCVLRPNGMYSGGFDFELLVKEFASWSEAGKYIMDFDIVVCDMMRQYCHLNKNDYNAIKDQNSNETDEEYQTRLYNQALRSDWKTVAKYFTTPNIEYLSWKDIWNIFQIEKYDLVKDENYIIETEFFIIYLHLPQYEKGQNKKVIFSNYCNKEDSKKIVFVQLSEANETKGNLGYNSFSKYELLSPTEYRSLLFSKPIVKFDGSTYELASGKNGFFGSNISFGYKYDGIYRVIGTDEMDNFVLERIDNKM